MACIGFRPYSKRQQTLCLRSLLNDAVTACDPKRKRRNKPRYRKARFHREKRSQLRTPGGGMRGKDGGRVSQKKPRHSCFSASGEHEHTGFKHTAAMSLKFLVFYFINVVATVQLTILNVYFIVILVLFSR